MTTNVQALVSQAIGTKSPLDGLLDIYNGYAARSRVERMRMKRELAYIKDETLFDSRALFSLTEAFRENLTPVVGIAPYAATKLEYNYRLAGERGTFSVRGTSILEFDIPKAAIERRNAAERERIAQMGEYRREWYYMQSMWPTATAYEAHVPPTPKALLPWNPITRRKLHVLFDADWKALPVDPYLLERVNGSQFRVVGHWDLTEQERKIMELIARQ